MILPSAFIWTDQYVIKALEHLSVGTAEKELIGQAMIGLHADELNVY